MTLPDIGGLVGVVLMLLAYGLAQLGRLKIDGAPALLLNLIGALLVLGSLVYRFNLPAVIIESAWALIALLGLLRLALKKRS